VSATASFTNYTANNFTEKDQNDLAFVFDALTKKGCHCMLSNSYTPFILNLYQNFTIKLIDANRMINSDGDKRGRIKEIVVLNYQI
jgi:DNA adenine methylase